MIQRPQSLFFLTVLVIAVMLIFSDIVFYTTSGEGANVEVAYDQTHIDAADGKEVLTNVPLISVLAGIAVLALGSIFLYGNRKLQASITAFNFVAIMMLVIFMYISSFNRQYFDESGSLTINALLPLALLFFNYIGLRGIRKDERLVRSMDRFR